MKPDLEKSTREIFLHAVEIENVQSRDQYLQRACEGDASLLEKVRRLIGIEEKAGLSKEILASVERIGPYKLLQQIGEGGCGVVYMAEQSEPVHRRVALKIIKLGMDTRQVVVRFEAERQALAMMDHPNIAKVFDAGATETGRPFFVMELVRGSRITDYCDGAFMDIKARLKLFIRVCQAVQHAHQKGIIHRDLKPSNVLVTDVDSVPTPKIIDFGIAKAMEGRLTDKTLFTAFEQLIGTPAYMSPEQAALTAVDIDTRTDIYSLGVLLYELLSGQTPFDGKVLMESGIEILRRTIQEKEPQRPSTRLSELGVERITTIARSRDTEGTKLASLLKGDLDWIVMRCLQKDRSRRYETANSLALDVQRHLDHEPVVARPPGRLYLLQKSVHRHKLAYAAGLMVAAALAAGLAVAAWQYAEKSEALERTVEAEAEQSRLREEAETQAERLRLRNYASDMNTANRALQIKDFGQLRRLMDRHRPGKGQKDLRGWEWRYLWQQARSDATAQLCSRGSQIIALCSSPDGRWLATGTAHEGGLLLLDLRNPGVEIRLLEETERVQAAFSPTDSILAFTTVRQHDDGQREATLHLWDLARGQLRPSRALDADCVGLAFAQDGSHLLTSTSHGTRGTITLWRMPDGTPQSSLTTYQHGDELSPQGFAATSDLGLTAYAERRKLFLVDLRSEPGENFLEELPSYVTALAFSPDGSQLAVASFDSPDIRIWDLETREVRRLKGHEAFVSALAFTPDGKRLLSGSGDRTIGIWDVATGRRLTTLLGHEHTVWRLHLLPDETTLVSGSKDGTVLTWNLDSPVRRPDRIEFPPGQEEWAFSSDSKSIITRTAERQICRWSGERFREKTVVLNLDADLRLSHGSFLSRDGRHVVLTSQDYSCRIVDLAEPSRSTVLEAPPGLVDFPAQFIGSDWVVLPYSAHHATVLDHRSGQTVFSGAPLPHVRTTLFNPVGRYFAQIAGSERLRLVSVPDGNTTDLRLAFHESANASAFSADGRFLAIPSFLGLVHVWETKTWEKVTILDGFLLGRNSACFSPDGFRLATGGESLPGEALRLFDTASWLDVLTLHCEGAHFVDTRFSPDGHALGTKDSLGRLTVWKVPAWEEIAREEAVSPGWIGHARD